MPIGLLDVSYIIAILIEIGMPIALALFFWKKYGASWMVFLIGLIFFLISLIRIPLNTFVSGQISKYFNDKWSFILIALFVSIAAGLFEEGVRILAFSKIIKQRSYIKGIMYGIGHGGGGESMIFVGFSVLANFLIYKFFPSIIPDIALVQIANITWYLPLVGALERIIAIIIQIALSVLVMNAFLNKKFYFIAIAIIAHMLVDFTAVVALDRIGIFYTELVLFGYAVLGLAAIIKLKPENLR